MRDYELWRFIQATEYAVLPCLCRLSLYNPTMLNKQTKNQLKQNWGEKDSYPLLSEKQLLLTNPATNKNLLP